MLCTWLRHLKVEKTADVSLGELCSSLKSLCTPVLRCITDKSFSYGRFTHNGSVLYKWLDYPRGGEIRNQVKAISVVKGAGTPWTDNNLFNAVKSNELKLDDDDKFETFYHGTDHKFVPSIIEGIDLRKGGKTKEFSDGDGFYVTNSFSKGKEWADLNFGINKSAVLVFRVSKEELRGDENCKGLDLTGTDKKEEWQNLVKKCLSSDRSFLNTVEGYDFIEGPLVDGDRKDSKGNFIPKKDSYQLCVRTDDCASLFDRSLAVVFFAPILINFRKVPFPSHNKAP